jgi:predicted O-methyltransferase YrrM
VSKLKATVRRILAHGLSRLPTGIFLDRHHFSIFERRGIHVTPATFYYPIPLLTELDESVWTKKSEMVGIDMNLDGQVRLIEDFSNTHFKEYFALNSDPHATPGTYSRNVGFGGSDGALLYSIIRSRKPKRIVEIGSGHSTLLSVIASKRNAEEGSPCEITAIEPYPLDYLHSALSDIGGKIIESRVEAVPLDVFSSLAENDILFIDSSHTVRVGGDVVFEINEILPRLKKGVVVHIHDIALPLNYPRDKVVEHLGFWAEQYLLQAFLAFNPKFRVLWCFSYVQAYKRELLQKHFPDYQPSKDWMASFWMETVF